MLTQHSLPDEIKAQSFELPEAYFRVFELGLTNLAPWRFIDEKEFQILFKGLRRRYPDKLNVPFARRVDNDDVACFVVRDSNHSETRVEIVHDYAAPGSEVDANLDTFWDWFRLAVNEMIEWT